MTCSATWVILFDGSLLCSFTSVVIYYSRPSMVLCHRKRFTLLKLIYSAGKQLVQLLNFVMRSLLNPTHLCMVAESHMALPVTSKSIKLLCRPPISSPTNGRKSASSNMLERIKKLSVPWNSSTQPDCFDDIILTCLRIGHTCLAHTHLVSQLHLLSCVYYNNDLTIFLTNATQPLMTTRLQFLLGKGLLNRI